MSLFAFLPKTFGNIQSVSDSTGCCWKGEYSTAHNKFLVPTVCVYYYYNCSLWRVVYVNTNYVYIKFIRCHLTR
jgi:hypothetical protein